MVLRELSKFAEKAAFFKQDGVDVVTYLPSRKTRTLDHFVVISQKPILQFLAIFVANFKKQNCDEIVTNPPTVYSKLEEAFIRPSA